MKKVSMRTDLRLVKTFLCLYSIYLVFILTFRMVFFNNFFAREFAFSLVNLQYFSPLLQYLSLIFNENCLQ